MNEIFSLAKKVLVILRKIKSFWADSFVSNSKEEEFSNFPALQYKTLPVATSMIQRLNYLITFFLVSLLFTDWLKKDRGYEHTWAADFWEVGSQFRKFWWGEGVKFFSSMGRVTYQTAPSNGGGSWTLEGKRFTVKKSNPFWRTNGVKIGKKTTKNCASGKKKKKKKS